MAVHAGWYANRLRQELILRNRSFARGRAHVESYGSSPVIVYEPDEGRHGNFLDESYAAIIANPGWIRRFDKIHAQAARSLPRPRLEHSRRWRLRWGWHERHSVAEQHHRRGLHLADERDDNCKPGDPGLCCLRLEYRRRWRFQWRRLRRYSVAQRHQWRSLRVADERDLHCEPGEPWHCRLPMANISLSSLRRVECVSSDE